MIKWLKTLFTPAQPDDRLVPLSVKDDIVPMQEPKEKEYVYVGDGMMEEVVRPKETDMQYLIRRNHEIQAERFKSRSQPKANPGPSAKPLNAKELKTRVQVVKSRQQTSSSAQYNYSPSNPAPFISGDSYDSGYSSCDSSSSGGCN